jgi:uncharacterized protein (TIGR00369 family)
MFTSDRPSGFDIPIPFVEGSGIRLLSASIESAVTELDAQSWHCNSAGYVHGGALMTLLDVSMAIAGRAHASDPGPDQTVMATVEMKASFMQGARGRLVSTARCIHRTRSLAFCEAEIRDSSNSLIAKGSGTFRFMTRHSG